MRRTFRSFVLAAMATAVLQAIAAPPVIAADAAPAARYSVTTTRVARLLDDPAANALLKKMIPTVYANEMFQTAGRELTLKDIQQYEPEALSEENLAKLQAELDKLPTKD